MNDTLQFFEDIYFNKFSTLTGEERLKMAVESFEVAKIISLASIDPDTDETSKKIFLLRRFYGDEKFLNTWEEILSRRQTGS